MGERVIRSSVAAVALVCVLVAGSSGASAQQPAPEVHSRLELKLGKPPRASYVRDAVLNGWIRQLPTTAPYEPPQLTAGSIWLPRGLALDGGDLPRCPQRWMREDQGLGRCPRRSIVGRPGWGIGRADAAVEDGLADADYVLVNGGARRIWALMTIYKPALVREVFAIRVHELRGRWAYRLDFAVPASLRIVAGVPISLRGFDLELDGLERAPGYLTFDRGCPKRGQLAYRASLTFFHNDATTTEVSRRGRLACRGAR